MNEVRKSDLLRVSLRLGLIHSTWCEGAMHSVGLAHCVAPALERIYPNEQDLKDAIQHYQSPFNTHPFAVGIVAGAALRLELEGRSGAHITSFIQHTMGPLGALGDPFFRGALLPLTAVVASLAAMLGGSVAGIVTLLILFNAAHLAVRFGGILFGYQEGSRVVPHIAQWLSAAHTNLLKLIAAVGAGVLLALEVTRFGGTESPWIVVPVGAAGLIAALCLKVWQVSRIYMVPVLLAIVLAIEVLL